MSAENIANKLKDLSDDKKLVATLSKLQSRIDSVKEIVDKCLDKDLYAKASPEDRVKYDLFLAYATTSLFWTYLRASGIDPRQHPINNEVGRIRNYMAKAKTVHDKHLRPKINQDASKRFVRNALWTAPENEGSKSNKNMSKKRKRLNKEDSND